MSNLTLQLDTFVRAIGVDRRAPHAVLLGAGASISSNIPSATMCTWEWKRNIFLTNNPGLEKQFSELTLPSVRKRIQKWFDSKGQYPADGSPEEYSFFIEKCFPISEHRRQFFAEYIRSAQPHIGYKMLCLMAEAEIIKSTWTTNFDGLVAKASVDFNITPIEVGIDCQHRAVRQPRGSELLCVSLHGDYRYDDLKNTSEELQEQEIQLKRALINEISDTNLIVIGYSGRDTSLMNALKEAYSQPGTTSLYWCGYGDEISDPVRTLLNSARAVGRQAYFVPTKGFDDTFARLALHCVTGNQLERAQQLWSEVSGSIRMRSEQFNLPEAPCKSLIKSNAFEIDYPSEVFTFQLKEWPEKPWDWLNEMNSRGRFITVPFRNEVLALGLLDDIRDVFQKQLSGPIERTPITDTDRNTEHGVVNALMRRALLSVFAESAGIRTNGRSLLWESKSYDKKQRDDLDIYVHRAVLVHLRTLSGQAYLVLKPTVSLFDAKGNEIPREITKIVKAEILGYQHNSKFNQALNKWRKKILPEKGTMEIEFPSRCGSTFRFKIRTAPCFAQIGSRLGHTPIRIDSQIQPLIKQQGIEIPEPKLLFSSQGGTYFARDSHPLRGLRSNRPFDFALTSCGLSPSIRTGIVCPAPEANLLSQYLLRSSQIHQPNPKEKDYLVDFPGFHSAFGIPLEIPRPGDGAWAVCPEPKIGRAAKEGSLELGALITRSIDTVVSAENPHVVIVFVPARWSKWREYRNDNEHFDLHDFVKAYCIQKGISTQFLEEETINSSQQCRVWWWLTVAIYAKAMRTPWVLEELNPDTAFVGLGFTVNRFALKGQHVVLGCSHLYNAQGEGLQFRLSKIENPIFVRRNPHMAYDDARRVGETIRQLFFESRFRLPPRVVIHKQTEFLQDEEKGLLDGLSGVDTVDLLEINIDASLRYVSSILREKFKDGKTIRYFDEDNYPVRRGTVVQISSRKALIWCHGVTDAVTPGWKYFLGKRHIPAPLLIRRHVGSTELETLATEILGLSKMDWNSADMYSKMPVTIHSSKQIARIGSKLQRFGPVSYDYRLFM